MNRKKSFEKAHERSKKYFLRWPDEFVGAYFARNDWNAVLDFGCGNGRHTQMLCELAKEKNKKMGGGSNHICSRFRLKCIKNSKR